MTPEAARIARERAKRALEGMRSSNNASPGAGNSRSSSSMTMYDGGVSGERSDACFDWSRGSCARGESCRFSHEGAPGANPMAGAHVRGPGSGSASPHRMAAGVCFDYAKGTCKRGDQCRFSHDAVAVAAFAKIASVGGGVGSGNGSTVSGSGSPTSGSGRLAASSIPKPLPISGALAAAAAKAQSGAGASGGVSSGGAVLTVEPAPIMKRTGAVDYASAAKAGVATATDGSFAAALVGKRSSENAGAAAAAQPPVPASPPPQESKVTPALTASGASVPAPRFPPAPNVMAAQPPMPATDAAASLAKPTYQFGTGSMLAPGGEQPRVDTVSAAAAVPKPNNNNGGSGGISFGTGAPAVPKAYPKPEFAFGSGAASTPPVAAPAGFVPPVPSGPPPVPAGPPPEANQRAHVAVAPAGFGFSQHGLGVATTPEKTAPQQSGSVWGASAPTTTANDDAAVVNGLGAEWDVSGMGMEGLAVDYSGTGTYDALGGASPFGVGLGYSLFSPSAAVQQTDASAAQRAQPQSMWGSNFGGYGGF